MLNVGILSKTLFSKTFLAFIICALFLGMSCGKRRPPQPPPEKVLQRTEIIGTQRGNVVFLFWKLPSQNAATSSVLNISRADVYRLVEPLAAAAPLSEEEFASRSVLISSQPVSEDDFRRNEMTFADTLEFAGQSARIRYAVRFVNLLGQKASFSNFVLIEPTASVAGSPILISGNVFEERIELFWKAPKENVNGTQPANITGYNVYRVKDGIMEGLNNTPVTDIRFSDRTFNFGANYKYFIRTVSLGGNGEPIESLDSNVIQINPIDIFPPSTPGAITIAAAPNNLSIFFALNPEKDVAGYRIYRSTNPNQPLSEWQLLTNELLTTNTFQDKNIESGRTYFYYLTATDKAGNVSINSAVVSETVP